MSENVKTPEEYFLQQSFWSGGQPDQQLTSAEQDFLRKYAGLGSPSAEVKTPASVSPVSLLPVETPAPEIHSDPAQPVPAASEASTVTASERSTAVTVQEQLRRAEETQLVSFYLCGQEYALPISMVQEVITYMEPTKLPAAPRFIAGIINLRGRVTPLVRLGELLQLTGRDEDRDRFIVICRHEGLQIGLIIHAVATMYRVRGEEVEWNIEARLGVGSQHLAGLLKHQEQLIGIIDVEQLVRTVLER